MSSINPQFKLRQPKNDVTSIFLMFYFKSGERFVYGTGLKVKTKYWDKENQRLKRVKVDESVKNEHNLINKKLEEYLDELYDIFRNLDKQKINPAKDILKRELDDRFKISSVDKSMDLIQFAEKVIEDCLNGERLTKKGEKIKHVTIKGYKTTVFHLNQFKKINPYRLNFDEINMKFYKKFVAYFQKKSASTNTIGKNIKNIKVFMKEAYKQGLSKNKIWEHEDFITLEEASDQIYLTMDELQRMYMLDYSDNKRMNRTRDLFILGCFTGLRSGDLENLSKDNIIDEGKMIRLRMKKTGDLVVIPLNPMVRAILDKYNGNPPDMIVNHAFNQYLKDLGKDADIIEQVTRTITKGGIRVDTTSPKYKLITVHTARRTFATNMFLAGVPAISIMKITGHKTEKSFLKYIRITAEENARMLLNHSFFS